MATYVKGSVVGKSETRQFEFRVLKRSAKMGLPQSAIDALGLSEVPDLPPSPTFADAAIRVPTYLSRLDFEGQSIHQYVAPASEPTIGSDALRALGYQVDLERGVISAPTEPAKIHRGLMPTMLDVSHLWSGC